MTITMWIWGLGTLVCIVQTMLFPQSCIIFFDFILLIFTVSLPQIYFLNKVCHLLCLPFQFRVVRRLGLEDDETVDIHYPISSHYDFRWNVEVNVDGFITKIVSRG